MHPTIRVQTTQPDDPPPGTIHTDQNGELLIYLGASITTQQIADLAHTVRQVRLATLIAPSLQAARTVRRSVQHYGKPSLVPPVRAPKMQLPPAPVLPPRERCGEPRSDGQPCQAYAGAGTMSRVGPCRAHGGQAIDHAKAEELADHALAWIRLNTRTEPLTPAEELVSLTAARALLIAKRDGLLG